MERLQLEKEGLEAQVYLLNSRWSMKEDQKCRKTSEGLANPIKLTVLFKVQNVDVFCPQEFSYDSIWWAFRSDAKPEDVLDLNKRAVEYDPFHGYYALNGMSYIVIDHKMMGRMMVQEGACIRERIPGITTGIPSSIGTSNDDSFFEADYKAFMEYAMKTEGDCTFKDEPAVSAIKCNIVTGTEMLTKYVECPSEPIIPSVFKAIIKAGNYFDANDKIFIQWNEFNEVLELEVSRFGDMTFERRRRLWEMYDVLKCRKEKVQL